MKPRRKIKDPKQFISIQIPDNTLAVKGRDKLLHIITSKKSFSASVRRAARKEFYLLMRPFGPGI